MILALIGFMGTGKSSVGLELAKRLNYQYIDIDHEIEKGTGLTISEIFSKDGEAYFRKLESDLLKELSKSDNLVLSTGGGIVLSSQNRELLQEKTIPILLQASVEEIFNRVKDDSERPLLSVADPLEKIKQLFKKRNKFYNEFDIKVNTDRLEIDEVVDMIMDKIAARGISIEEVSKDGREK